MSLGFAPGLRLACWPGCRGPVRGGRRSVFDERIGGSMSRVGHGCGFITPVTSGSGHPAAAANRGGDPFRGPAVDAQLLVPGIPSRTRPRGYCRVEPDSSAASGAGRESGWPVRRHPHHRLPIVAVRRTPANRRWDAHAIGLWRAGGSQGAPPSPETHLTRPPEAPNRAQRPCGGVGILSAP